MSSSANDYSDSGEADEQHQHSEAFSYSTSTAGTPEAVHTGPSVPYAVPPPVGAMAQAALPYPDPYYRSIFAPYDPQPYAAQPYPPQPMVHLQLMGIQQAGLPLPSDAVEEPVFVNAKQYHGILRRRQSRAKAESENKAIKVRKAYLHESRHLHALKRARGCGGRFSKKKNHENGKELSPRQENEAASGGKSQPISDIDKGKTKSNSAENSS